MKWIKKGLIFEPDKSLSWSKQYAGIPTVEIMDDEFIRVYYYSMDEVMDGRISYVDLDIENPGKILRVHKEPVLDIGDPGCFDDSGVCPSCILNHDGRKFLYYLGVQRCEKAHLYFAGLAIADEATDFRKYSAVPILDRTETEPFIRSATSVIRDGNLFKMWYVSAKRWTTFNGKRYPEYVVRHADSKDAIRWSARHGVCIDLKDSDEFGIGRPWVIKENHLYKMWYSIRSRTEPYRMGYAESSDGLAWVRKDGEVGIERSGAGWDSEMICYPCVVDARGERYMFYNGNRHGLTGFGYAVLDEP